MAFVPTSTLDAINFTFFAIVFTATVLRLLTRAFLLPKLGTDDLHVTLALAFGLSYIIILHFEVGHLEWIHKDIIDLPKEQQEVQTEAQWHHYTHAIRLLIFDNMTQLWATSFAKLSLMAFYRRITPFRKHRMALYIIDAMIVGNGISHTMVTAFATRPVPCQFNFGAYRDTCAWVLKTIVALSMSSGFQIFIDILACSLPWVVLRKLKINRAIKIKLVLMYSSGLLSMAFSAVRIYAVNYKDLTHVDWLEAQFRFDMWSVIEPFTAILCVNVPGLVAGAGQLYAIRHPSDKVAGSDRYGSYSKGSGRGKAYYGTKSSGKGSSSAVSSPNLMSGESERSVDYPMTTYPIAEEREKDVHVHTSV
ncbi:MAG: hypothetical protein M1815_000192 [Lichina confinis]|nr:MAG: hypothetical protein M1815_000192 [Lichina confinis]